MFIPLNMVRIVSTHCHIQLLLLEKVIYSALMIISHYFSGWQVPLMGYAWIYSIWMVMFGSSLTYSIFLGRTFLSATLKKWTSVSRVWMMISIFSRIPIIVFKKTFLGFALLYTYIYICIQYFHHVMFLSFSGETPKSTGCWGIPRAPAYGPYLVGPVGEGQESEASQGGCPVIVKSQSW